MLKLFSNHKKEKELTKNNVNPLSILWIEIPVSNLNRAIRFYENVFMTSLKKQMLLDQSIAVFKESELGIKGCLIQVQGTRGSIGIRPVIFVNVMFESIEKVKTYGGSVITMPFLLKQAKDTGEVIIGENLIDQQIGYICEIVDTEGNGLLLYSHS